MLDTQANKQNALIVVREDIPNAGSLNYFI